MEIPEEWIVASNTSVIETEEDDAGEDTPEEGSSDESGMESMTTDEDATTPDDSSDTPSAEDSPAGEGFTTTTGMTVTNTQTLVTLPDGSQAITITSSAIWSAGFSWADSGGSSLDASDVPDDLADELSSMTFTATSEWDTYASGSIAAGITTTVTVPTIGFGLPDLTQIADAEVGLSIGFAISGRAGGSHSSSLVANVDESSGSESDGTDEYLRFDINDRSKGSSNVEFSFSAIVGTDDSDSTDASGPGPSGTSAADMVTNGSPGVQVGFALTTSSSESNSSTIEEKTRGATLNYDEPPTVYFTETKSKEKTKNKSDFSVNLALGTNENSFSLSNTGSESEEINDSYTHWESGPDGSLDGFGSETWFVQKFDGSSESDDTFEVGLGGSAGTTLTNESNFSVEYTDYEKTSDIPEESGGESGYITRTEYRDGSDDDVDQVDRQEQEFFSPDTNYVYVIYDNINGVTAPPAPSVSYDTDPAWFEEPSGWDGYWHYLTNPSSMDDDLETGFYAAAGTAAVAGGGAAALTWGPAALAASAEYTVPTLSLAPGGMGIGAGGTGVLTGTTVVVGSTTVTVTGAHVATTAGALGGWMLFSKLQEVDIRRLQTPNSRPYADAGKLKSQGPFDIDKYTPALVRLRKNGVMVIMNGVTRIENALRCGITKLIVEIID